LGGDVQKFLAGGVAALVGAGLAAATAFGVVNTVSGTSAQPERDVVDYGTTVTD
jgi:hypothetical protein